MVGSTPERESNPYSIVTKYSELSGGALGPLSQFSAVLSPLVTIGRPVTVGGGLRRDKVFGVLLSDGLAVLSVSLTERGTPSGPRTSGGTRGRESRKGRERDTIGRLGSRDGRCLGEGIVVDFPLVAILGPGRGCSPRQTVSHNTRKRIDY
jgi:hypothetical protein